jgi:hypothetical protein
VSQGRKLRWTIASARQNLPALVDLAAREPQDIYRRNELVARVVSPDDKVIPAPRKPSAAELLARIQRACCREDFSFEVPQRRDRPNPFVPERKARRR